MMDIEYLYWSDENLIKLLFVMDLQLCEQAKILYCTFFLLNINFLVFETCLL